MSQPTPPNVNIGGPALGAIWTLVTIALLIVTARCYTQRFVTHQFGLSEILIIISACIFTGMASLVSVQYHYGWGRHFIYIPPTAAMYAVKYNIICQSFGIMGPTFGRLSFIVLMVKLFGTTKARRGWLWALWWSQLITNGITVITLYVQCKDVRALWDFSIVSSCWDPDIQNYIAYAHSAWNGFTDLFLTFLPATMLWTLQLKTKTKLGLIFLLSLSFLAFVGVCMKMVYIGVLAHRGDYTYNTVPFFTWVVVESTLVAIAGSVALLRPLVAKVPILSTSRPTNNSYVLEKYGKGSKRDNFSKLADSHHSLATMRENDAGSEDNILSVQDNDTILKQVTYSVKVSDLEAGSEG